MTQSAQDALAAAALRLRGKPGRPRKHGSGPVATAEPAATTTATAMGAVAPRLFGLAEAAVYLGISSWSVRTLLDAGHVRRVTLPGRAGDGRRVLIDKADLDALVELGKRT